LRSYLSQISFARPKPFLTPKFMARMGMLPPAVTWKTQVARHTLGARVANLQKPCSVPRVQLEARSSSLMARSMCSLEPAEWRGKGGHGGWHGKS
jgi:hypothetical protein